MFSCSGRSRKFMFVTSFSSGSALYTFVDYVMMGREIKKFSVCITQKQNIIIM